MAPNLRPVLIILGGEVGSGRTGGGELSQGFSEVGRCFLLRPGNTDLTALSSVQFGSRHHSSWVEYSACGDELKDEGEPRQDQNESIAGTAVNHKIKGKMSF